MEQITCSSQGKRRKWSLGLGRNLKALGVMCVRSHSTRDIKNAFRKREQHLSQQIEGTISFTVNSFLPYLRLMVKIFQFLRLSTKFLAVLRLSVNPIETLLKGKGQGALGKGSFRRERNAKGTRGRREGGSHALIPFPFPFERLPRRLSYDKRWDTSLLQFFLILRSRLRPAIRVSATTQYKLQLHLK